MAVNYYPNGKKPVVSISLTVNYLRKLVSPIRVETTYLNVLIIIHISATRFVPSPAGNRHRPAVEETPCGSRSPQPAGAEPPLLVSERLRCR